MLPLLLSLLLRDEDREIWDGSLARPGLRMDLEEIFIDEEERREVKQMNSSLVLLVLPLLVARWGLSDSIPFLFHGVSAINRARIDI